MVGMLVKCRDAYFAQKTNEQARDILLQLAPSKYESRKIRCWTAET